MKNTVLAPVIALLAILLIAWGGLFGLAQATKTSSTRQAAPAPSATASTTPSARETSTPARSSRATTQPTPSRTTRVDEALGGSGDDSSFSRSSSADRSSTQRAAAPAPGRVDDPADSFDRDLGASGASSGADRRSGAEVQAAEPGHQDTATGLERLSQRFSGEKATQANAADPDGLTTRGGAAVVVIILLIALANGRGKGH